MAHNTNNIDMVLGQKVDSPTTYTPSILVREERSRNRKHLNISDKNLPFVGYDIWNGYECSALTNSGLPVTCVAKVVYEASNKYIVESKSMKLYWNSFNMQRMGKTKSEVLKNIKTFAQRDLSKLLGTDVKIGLFSQVTGQSKPDLTWADKYTPADKWVVLEDQPYARNNTFDSYTEDPSLLKATFEDDGINEYRYMTTLLRSNCKITKQPDSGDLYIQYKSKYKVNEKSLLEWIVSMRSECHFHEEILECAYKRLYDLLEPTELLVTAFYARRGGWDIVPTRASSKKLLDKSLCNSKVLYTKMPRQ